MASINEKHASFAGENLGGTNQTGSSADQSGALNEGASGASRSANGYIKLCYEEKDHAYTHFSSGDEAFSEHGFSSGEEPTSKRRPKTIILILASAVLAVGSLACAFLAFASLAFTALAVISPKTLLHGGTSSSSVPIEVFKSPDDYGFLEGLVKQAGARAN